MDFPNLKRLAEARMPSSEETRRRNFFKNADRAVNQLEAIFDGNTLKSILKDGNFPETEANAVKKAFDKFYDEYEDLKMALLNEFTNYDE